MTPPSPTRLVQVGTTDRGETLVCEVRPPWHGASIVHVTHYATPGVGWATKVQPVGPSGHPRTYHDWNGVREVFELFDGRLTLDKVAAGIDDLARAREAQQPHPSDPYRLEVDWPLAELEVDDARDEEVPMK